uniref:CFA20 domain-containing protein n=1 Tax=Populus davidiana TaxID=266767 RepID=A0A6M2FBN6_9ROSI
MIRMSGGVSELPTFKCTVTRVKPYICTMPLKLDEGWNQIQLNLADFTRRAYGTNYVETLRVQVHANCRLRRIYFSDRLYSEEELPPEFKLYLPVQQVRIPCTAPLVLASSWLLYLGVCFSFFI